MKQNTYKWGTTCGRRYLPYSYDTKNVRLNRYRVGVCLCSDMGAYCIDPIACTRIVLQYYNKF